MLLLTGCESPPPTTDKIEELLSVAFPSDVEVVGGRQDSDASVLLIVSDKLLPLPPGTAGKRQSKRPRGVAFPVTALSSLAAAQGVLSKNVPAFTNELGRCHDGQIGEFRFSYREASTTKGWLTAVEVYNVEKPIVEDD
jgi:hypothetical protein